MKIIIFCLLLLACGLVSKAQLANTKWTGTMLVPNEQKVTLSFKTDSLFVLIDNVVVESMTYSIKDSTINVTKVDGKSPCELGPFILQFLLKGNQLFIKDISDSCGERKNAWVLDPFIKED